MAWQETTAENYHDMLGALWPALWLSHGFLLGEPYDHNADGVARFNAFVEHGGRHYAGGPMTPAEFRAFKAADLPGYV